MDIAAICGCSISALKTADGKVYFWGYAYGHLFRDPEPTNFTSLPELFASIDSRVMLQPLKIDVKQPTVVEKLIQSFDDQVN